MDTLMFKLGVRDGQTTTSREVQQENMAWVHIKEVVPLNHTPPDQTVITHVGIEAET